MNIVSKFAEAEGKLLPVNFFTPSSCIVRTLAEAPAGRAYDPPALVACFKNQPHYR